MTRMHISGLQFEVSLGARGNTTLTDPRSQRNQVGRRGGPVARVYSRQLEISQTTSGLDGAMADNNRIEQDHRGIKSRYQPMRGFKGSPSATRFCRSHDEVHNFLRPRSKRNHTFPRV